MNSWSEEVLPNIEMLCWQLVTQMASKCFAMKPKFKKSYLVTLTLVLHFKAWA
jgi:uncharacterized protein YjaG (DUF416 family)